ncbi:MAG: hypothetical protein HY698_00805 [Deltaproteobacteria bacterium]|nr:hypothetical protein [Deltaproteobacteria bacterium]
MSWRVHSLPLLAWAATCFVSSDREASAEPRRAVAVLDVVIEGDAPPELRESLERSMADGLGAAGWTVVSREETMQKLRGVPELVGCVTTTCLERIGPLVGARRFLRGRVEAAGASYTIELELLGADVDGGGISRMERSCAVCTIGEANEAMSHAASELKDRERPKPLATTRVPVPSVPEIVVGVDKPAPPQERRPTRGWKWVTAGAGGAAFASGVVFLAIDGMGVSCPGDRGPCKDLLDTRLAGALLAGMGVALGGLSTWIFVNDRLALPRAAIVPAAGGGASLFLGVPF